MKSILGKSFEKVPSRRVRRLARPKRNARESILAKIESGEYQLEEASCLCGSSNFDLVSNFDRDYLPIGIKICIDCGLVLQSPRLAQEALSSFYNTEYRDMYNPGMRGNYEYYKETLDKPQAAFSKIMSMVDRTPETVFEVGMHYGALLHDFQRAGSNVTGVDMDPGGLAFAREELGINAIHGGSDRLLELGEQADLLMYIHVLEHINDLDREFQIMQQLVKDGGFLYLSLPGAVHWPRLKEDNILCTLQLAHTWYFSLPHIAYYASLYGFELVQGDNEVDALFIKSKTTAPLPAPNEYDTVKRELQEVHQTWTRRERLRKIKQFFRIK